MILRGVDGCPAGWLAVSLDLRTVRVTPEVFPDAASLFRSSAGNGDRYSDRSARRPAPHCRWRGSAAAWAAREQRFPRAGPRYSRRFVLRGGLRGIPEARHPDRIAVLSLQIAVVEPPAVFHLTDSDGHRRTGPAQRCLKPANPAFRPRELTRPTMYRRPIASDTVEKTAILGAARPPRAS
jgi:hypothetical protein